MHCSDLGCAVSVNPAWSSPSCGRGRATARSPGDEGKEGRRGGDRPAPPRCALHLRSPIGLLAVRLPATCPRAEASGRSEVPMVGPVKLRLIRDATPTCEVTDSSSTSPHLRHAEDDDEGGRGLYLVSEITQNWGYCRGRPGLHQPVGCAALAETADHPAPEDVPSRCRRYRDRETRPRTPGPGWGLPCSNGVESSGKDGTAPTRPERSCRASDHPGRTRHPGA